MKTENLKSENLIRILSFGFRIKFLTHRSHRSVCGKLDWRATEGGTTLMQHLREEALAVCSVNWRRVLHLNGDDVDAVE